MTPIEKTQAKIAKAQAALDACLDRRCKSEIKSVLRKLHAQLAYETMLEQRDRRFERQLCS